ncbi:hypothetical protein D8S78_10905 [Natrialba swarupiae]|nr:hypothetical protein [Natrialba swarupiae]
MSDHRRLARKDLDYAGDHRNAERADGTVRGHTERRGDSHKTYLSLNRTCRRNVPVGSSRFASNRVTSSGVGEDFPVGET